MSTHHDRYDFSPVTERDFDLPNDATIAVWICINVEYDRFDQPVSTAINQKAVHYTPDVFNYAWREYGLRVGIWRLMNVLDRYDVRATVALNSDICDHAPEIVRAGIDREWEFMGHGVTNSNRLVDLDRKAESETIKRTRDRIEQSIGKPPTGWLSPGLSETHHTLDLLSEWDFTYVCDWCNDEQPYLMQTQDDSLVSVPYSIELNDITMFLRYCFSPTQYTHALNDYFDELYRESKNRGNAKVMAISLHPFLTGHPHRSKYLEKTIAHINDHDNVWFATGNEIATHFIDTYC